MSESTVHRVTFDLDRYQALVYDLPGGQPEPFDGVSRASTWLPQPVYVAGPRLERPDIWFLFGSGALVFDEEVARQLEPFVSYAGELLELRLSPNDEQLWALNVLQDVDALDPSGCSDDDVRIVPRFIEHRLPESGLFKVFPIEAANL